MRIGEGEWIEPSSGEEMEKKMQALKIRTREGETVREWKGTGAGRGEKKKTR